MKSLDEFRSRMRVGWTVPVNMFPDHIVYEWIKTNRMSKREFKYWLINR